MKNYLVIIISILALSCNKSEFNDPESSLIKLNYPVGSGQSGDTLTSVLGYGYDGSGIYDTISVKAKVLNLSFQDWITISKPFYTGPGTVISGVSYSNLLGNMEYYPNRVTESHIAFLSHIKSLSKIALNSDSIDKDCAYAYYSFHIINRIVHYRYLTNSLFNESELTSDFKNDINALTAEEIVEKYGTHFISDASTGAKLEVLYKCKVNSYVDPDDIMEALHERMTEYFGEVPGMPIYEGRGRHYSLSNEQIIFNTMGFCKKLFGLINITNNNSDNISIDLNTLNEDKPEYQFMKLGKEGLIPLYDIISDSEKKQELKNYIESYLSK